MKAIPLFALPILLLSCSTPAYVNTNPGQQSPAYTDNGNYNDDSNYSGPTETSYQVFYDELSPYGTWIDHPDYGYVWQPNVDPGFRPYATNGHWVYSNEGWTWASDYNWGWAPFHYGRWFYDDNAGWLWVPGHQWAPAWVTWGRSGDYYGWAPLGPEANPDNWTPPQNTWNFVPAQHVARPDVASYVVNNRTTDLTNITKNVTIINNVTKVNNVTNTVTNNNVTNNSVTNNVTNNRVNNNTVNNNMVNNNRTTTNTVVHVINSAVYNRGPAPAEVEAATKTTVRPVVIATKAQPGKTQVTSNTLMVYRPVVKPAPQNKQGAKAAPAKVQNYQPKQ